MKVTIACLLLLLPLRAFPQEPKQAEEKSAAESKSAPETAKRLNPVKPTPNSIASGKKSYTYDCAMCHGKDGAGDGDLAGQMDLKLRDYRELGALKELLYQVVMREWDMPEEKIVEEIFGFLKRGYLRVDDEGRG